MNEQKLKQLLAAARPQTIPAPPPGFAADVLRAVRAEPPSLPAGQISVWDHLNGLFPRLATAAVAVILLCVAADWGLTAAGLPGISDGMEQMTSQFLLPLEEL